MTDTSIPLEIRNLTVDFETDAARVRALSDFGYSISRGETLAVVGESGSGKTVHALAIMGLLPVPPARITSGSVIFKGRELLGLPQGELRKIRGAEISMIFQDPMTSLNPVLTIGRQITETLLAHEACKPQDAPAQAAQLLAKVGIPNPVRKLSSYPHQFSGGMRQRVMIALALACNPDVLIADEPTTALDVTIQAQILSLIDSMKKQSDMAVVLITHNLGIVAEHADHVMVMYSGRIMETADTARIFEKPAHPYTKGLLSSIPSLFKTEDRLSTIPGHPSPAFNFKGCAFAARCPVKMSVCDNEEPPLFELEGGQRSRCWLCGKQP